MFKSKKAAAQVNEDMLTINTLLNYSLIRVRQYCSDSEFKTYRRKVGAIMGITTIDVLPEIWKRHPSVMPAEFREAVSSAEDTSSSM